MFCISYLDEKDRLSHKHFNNIKDAQMWVEQNNHITPLKLLVWDDSIDCYSTFKSYR